MIKLLGLDNQDWERLDGVVRTFETPQKFPGNPIAVSDHWSDGDRMTFYGSVLRRPDTGLWQLWYIALPDRAWLAYAESDDGITWRKPELEVARHGDRWTNLLFTGHPWGPTIIFDEREERPEWRYKMVVGLLPSDQIGVHHSPDGIHWSPAADNPVIAKPAGSPMSVHRRADGQYVLYHRPEGGRRVVGRSESSDFVHWSSVRTVLEADQGDPPDTQLYALGAAPYGAFEVGALWVFKSFPDDLSFEKSHGRIETELAYCRSGYAWHRAAQGTPFIALGDEGSWDWGCIQAASAPVYLEDEIRFYYTATRNENAEHKRWRGDQPRCGLGFVSLKPDRFVSLTSQVDGGTLLTRPFRTTTPNFAVNAAVARGGQVRLEVTNLAGEPLEGFDFERCLPITGDSTGHTVHWQGDAPAEPATSVTGQPIRLRVRAHAAKLYALSAGHPTERATYWRFSGAPSSGRPSA